jgi:DNA polymerase III subunit delta
MDYAKFTKIISTLPDSPIFVLVGEDDYLLNLASDAIVGKVRKKNGNTIEKHIYYADASSARDAIAPLESQGFFSSSSIVIIHDIDKYGTKDTEALSSYITRPNKSSMLIMIAASIDKRKVLYKHFQKKDVPVIELKATSEEELAAWIRAIALQKGKSISSEAIKQLALRIGGNLGIAAMEVKKLVSYIGASEEIESHHVEELVGRSRVDSAFDLSNAIAQRDVTAALSIVKTLLEEGESEIGMIALLRWQFLRILRGKSLEMENVPRERIPSELGVNFYQREFLDILARFEYSSALKAYLALFDADISLRGKMLDSRYIVENLIITLCNA